ncbi:MAG: hypothetical protein J1F68_03765 [Clostridiales bacterium]|nr:hypothetical protein [Clostridiales bacterium]
MLTPITNKTKCDVRDCKNDAEYFYPTKGRTGKCFLCSKCLAELSTQGRTVTVPKSPKNTIKKKMEMAQEQNYDEK